MKKAAGCLFTNLTVYHCRIVCSAIAQGALYTDCSVRKMKIFHYVERYAHRMVMWIDVWVSSAKMHTANLKCSVVRISLLMVHVKTSHSLTFPAKKGVEPADWFALVACVIWTDNVANEHGISV